jgi:hypothetical protein
MIIYQEEIFHIIIQFCGGLFAIHTASLVNRNWYLSLREKNKPSIESLWTLMFNQEFPYLELIDGEIQKLSEYKTAIARYVAMVNVRSKDLKLLVTHASTYFSEEFIEELTSDKCMKCVDFLFNHSLQMIPYDVDNDDNIPVGYSKLGGHADLPMNYSISESLSFVLQVNLRHASAFTRYSGLLPQEGMLYFFVHKLENESEPPVIYLSQSDLKKYGKLARRSDIEPLDDTPKLLHFRYKLRLPYEITCNILKRSWKKTSSQHTIGNFQKIWNNLRRRYEMDHETCFQSEFDSISDDPLLLLDRISHVSEEDAHFIYGRFNGFKLINLHEVLESDENPLTAYEVLSRYNMKNEEDPYQHIYQYESIEQLLESEDRTSKNYIRINQFNFDVLYHVPVDNFSQYKYYNFRECESNDVINNDNYSYILLMKSDTRDKCEAALNNQGANEILTALDQMTRLQLLVVEYANDQYFFNIRSRFLIERDFSKVTWFTM